MRFDPVARQWNPIPTTGLPGDGLNRIVPGKDVVWGLRADKQLAHFDGTTWKTNTQNWQGLGLACAGNGTLYLIGLDNTLFQRAGNGTWQSLNVQADDVAVTSKDKLWYCRQGKAFTRGESGWQELSPSGVSVQRLSPGPDGAIAAYAADGRSAMLVPGTTAWTSTGNPAPADSVAQAKSAPVTKGDVWLLRNDGVLTRILSAERGAQVPFDAAPKADSPYASRIDVWYDEVGIRSIQVIFPGLRLTMTSGVANFGIAETTTAAPDLSEDAGG
ncbi:hypothetical protein AB0D63_44490, partial [Kitasatospora sp. NPDC048343]